VAVEALVLHGAHVEVVHGDDHEDVQIVFATVDLFIPTHGFLQAVHGVLAFVDVFRLDVNAQRHVALGHGGKGVFDTPQITGHQREQVRRFLERVLPGRPVPAIFAGPRGNRVAVGQQHRIAVLLGDHGGGERAHYVRTVEVIGDLAETFGLALGAEHRAGFVQAFQRGVGFRVDPDAGIDREGGTGRVQGQMILGQLVIGDAQLAIGQRHRQQFQLLTVQHQRRQARTTLGVTAHHQLRMDQAVVLEQLEGQVRFVDQVLGSLIVLEVDHLRLFGAHAGVLTDARRADKPCIYEC